MNLQFRQLESHEGDKFFDLMAIMSKALPEFRRELEDTCYDKRNVSSSIICEVDGEVVGGAYAPAKQDSINLYFMSVRPAERQKGIGSRLLTFLEESAKNSQSGKVKVFARDDKIVAWYQDRGYILQDDGKLVLSKDVKE